MLHREQLRGDHKEEEKREREKDVRAGFLFSKSIRYTPIIYPTSRGQVESEQFILIARPWIQKVHKSWSIDTNSEIGMMERLMIENLTSGSK